MITFDDLDKDEYGKSKIWLQDRKCYDWAKSIIEDTCTKVEISWSGPRGAECYLIGYKGDARRTFRLQYWVLDELVSHCFIQKRYDTPETREEILMVFTKGD